jgi:rRNA maturation endonuclease Nob1
MAIIVPGSSWEEEIIMSKSFQQRCMLCGRVFEIEALSEIAPQDKFLDPPPKKSRAFCPMCEAKIKKEAEDTQKEPKPM